MRKKLEISQMEYDFKSFRFGRGAHARREDGMCIMEAVAYVGGEVHSDAPACACPVIASFLRVMNDNLPDERRTELLGNFVFRLVGTKATQEIEYQRACMVAGFAVRVAAPFALRASGEYELADKLESLPEIIDRSASYAAARAARAASYAPSAAAHAVSAASYAASYAPSAAARAASAASYAAAYAASAADGDIWIEAASLVDRMIRLTEHKEASVLPAHGSVMLTVADMALASDVG